GTNKGCRFLKECGAAARISTGDGGFADRAELSILLARLACWSALIPGFRRCWSVVFPSCSQLSCSGVDVQRAVIWHAHPTAGSNRAARNQQFLAFAWTAAGRPTHCESTRPFDSCGPPVARSDAETLSTPSEVRPADRPSSRA